MNHTPLKSVYCALASLFCFTAGESFAQDSVSPAHDTHHKNTILKEDFEGSDAAESWPLKQGLRIEREDGNHFYRMHSTTPGGMVLAYKEISIPEGVQAIQITWKERVQGLKRGEKSWFDARLMMEYKDSSGRTLGQKPPGTNNSKDTDGWVERSKAFNVPAEAARIKFMPTLFKVNSGTYDLDDIEFYEILKIPKKQDAAKPMGKSAGQPADTRQQKTAKADVAPGSIIPNGDFESDANNDGNPNYWGGGNAHISYLSEGGNTFMRITTDTPDEMVMNYRKFDIPDGVEALEFSWDWRITDLKPGTKSWHDARIMMKILDAEGNEAKRQPPTPYQRKSKDEWHSATRRFSVSDDAATLEFMPTLFKVKRGTMDLDNLQLKPISGESLRKKQAARAAEKARMHVEPEEPQPENWPSPLKVVGNRLHDADGNEVWLQGVNVDSLEWTAKGEHVLKSTLVAIDEWGANCIRLPMKDSYWYGEKGDQYRKLIDDIITLTANRGAYLALDLHRYRAPKGAHIKFWKDAATRYKNHPAVLFDLINEPHGVSWEVWRNGGFVSEKKKKADEDAFLSEEEKKKNAQGFQSVGMQALVDAVRGQGANNIVIVGGLDWAYDLSGILKGYAIEEHPGGNGVMYSTHVYPWKRGWKKNFLEVAAKHPIFIGELGADAKKMDWMPHEIQEDAETWVPDMIAVIQKHRLNWTAFSFHPSSSPRMLLDWDYTPTPYWGEPVKEAFSGKTYELDRLR